jgi:hypothetical protein
MGSPRALRRWPALTAVIAGVALFTLGVHGMTRVDTRLELAATAQQVAAAKHEKAAHHRDRAAKRDRKGV